MLGQGERDNPGKEDDGAGNLDTVVAFIAAFLGRFRPEERVTLSYADMSTNSRDRCGGGDITIGKDGEIEEA
jgi:hypothetical protein